MTHFQPIPETAAIMNILAAFALTANSAPGVYYAFEHSDNVGKSIVVLLILLSIFTWSVMIDKGIALHRAKKCSRLFSARFKSHPRNIASPMLIHDAENNPGPVAQVYSAGVRRLLEFYENDSPSFRGPMPGGAMPIKLSSAQYNAIEAELEREVSSQIEVLEQRIGYLGTMVSVCPFCGLFGTVWGVMLAFCGIAAAGKADFTALAPGVAGALLTTVAGLIVAVPSLIGYNTLNTTIRSITVSMDNFVEDFMARLRLEQLEFDRGEGSGAIDE